MFQSRQFIAVFLCVFPRQSVSNVICHLMLRTTQSVMKCLRMNQLLYIPFVLCIRSCTNSTQNCQWAHCAQKRCSFELFTRCCCYCCDFVFRCYCYITVCTFIWGNAFNLLCFFIIRFVLFICSNECVTLPMARDYEIIKQIQND